MRLFKCQNCGQVLFFENKACGRCGFHLGFLPVEGELSALKPGVTLWEPLARTGTTWRFCENARKDVCNWMIPARSSERFCLACRHNRMVPDLSMSANLLAWNKLELAKHRLFYTLLRLGLPTPNRADDPQKGLVFDFLADPVGPDAKKVMTGHDDGLITLALAEADDPEREARRARMGEPYRTLLGHFRHEVGHFYWDLLVRDGHRLEKFRDVFGDERADYMQALQMHYQSGPPPYWQDHFVSAYATSHPWEDWAESWAHYLHIVDSLETAEAFGLDVHPGIDSEATMTVSSRLNPYAEEGFGAMAHAWSPLTIALNAMNQSMGMGDLYPFVLSPAVITKLGFIHDLMREQRAERAAA